jgi:uncharacterized damage-inducible protein DinB
MARYNRWATSKLLTECSKLTDEERHRNCGLFFQSITGTLTHILLAETLWLGRMTGTDVSQAYPGIASYWGGPREQWASVLPSFEALQTAMMQSCEVWTTTVAQYPEVDLQASFVYRTTKGEERQAVRWKILDHVFNHSTHHRGQVSAALTLLGHGQELEMDLLYFDDVVQKV